jgi:hypothetical protein
VDADQDNAGRRKIALGGAEFVADVKLIGSGPDGGGGNGDG